MATFDPGKTAEHTVQFCPECGQAAGSSNFCSNCGHNMGFASDRTLADTTLQPPAGDGAQKRRGRVGFVIAGGVVGLVAIAVGVIVLLNSHSSNASSATVNTASITYKQQLSKVLAPLVSANQGVSNSLTGLNGSKTVTNTAKTRTTEALAALSTAKGGLEVLHAPTADTTLAGQVQQAVTADNGYLQAVSSTLATPTGSGAGQLQTLSTGAQTAMVNLDPVVSGASASITGTSNLVSWSQGAIQAAANAAKKAAAAKSAASGSSGSSTGSSASSGSAPAVATASTPSPTPPGMSACDQNISVNASTTTCGFADSVFASYAQVVQANGGPLSTDVTATSGTTGQTYDDYCAYNSSDQIVECSHGTDLIQFPEWAASVYNG
jgi:hypothetical protein